MTTAVINKKVHKAFSKAAGRYENLTSIQKEIGGRILRSIGKKRACKKILDVGMGTGWLTNQLVCLFPEADIFGIDFSMEMLRRARRGKAGLKLVQADAVALPFKKNTFDIILSNSSYQWVDDLDKAFQSSYDLLNDKGVFCFAMFGSETLNELFFSIQHVWSRKNGNKKLSVKLLPDRQDVMKIMRSSKFSKVNVKCDMLRYCFTDMFALVKWLKSIGANAIEKNFFVGKDLLVKTNDFYNERFADHDGVYATFEVIWVEAHK